MGNLLAAELAELESLTVEERFHSLRSNSVGLRRLTLCPQILSFQQSKEIGPLSEDEELKKKLGAKEIAAAFSPDDEERFDDLKNALRLYLCHLKETANSQVLIEQALLQNDLSETQATLVRWRRLLPRIGNIKRLKKPIAMGKEEEKSAKRQFAKLGGLVDALKKAESNPSLYSAFITKAAKKFTEASPFCLNSLKEEIQAEIDTISGGLKSIATGATI